MIDIQIKLVITNPLIVDGQTREQQANNRVNNRLITFRGETLNIKQWARKIGIPDQYIHYRLNAGWTIEETLTLPPDPNRKVKKYQTRKAA